jgi:large-conductance mechanosensitive channel
MAAKTSAKKSVTKKTSAKKAATSAAEAKRAAARAKAAAAKAKAAEVTKGHANGFMNFIREQGVVGLAVGLAIGTAAGDTVRKLVQGFIDPIVVLIIGSQQSLATATYTVTVFGRQASFAWGAFVSSLITLVAVALVVYAFVHMLKLDRIDKKKDS